MKHILFADDDNEVVGITGCVDDWEPEKEFVVAVMSMGYTLLVTDDDIDPLYKTVEVLAQGDALYAQATRQAKAIEKQLAYDVEQFDEIEQPW